MFTTLQLTTFVSAAMLLLVLPGPGVAYVVARGASLGAIAAIASAFGLAVGVMVHVFAAVVGISALLQTSAVAFTVLKLCGAAYLIYLGVSALRSASGSKPTDEKVRATSKRRLILDGIVVSAFNPKIAIFFLAFLPQFIAFEAGNPTLQICALGLIYATLAFFTDSAYGVSAALAGKALRANKTVRRWGQRAVGVVLIGLGLRTALAKAN